MHLAPPPPAPPAPTPNTTRTAHGIVRKFWCFCSLPQQSIANSTHSHTRCDQFNKFADPLPPQPPKPETWTFKHNERNANAHTNQKSGSTKWLLASIIVTFWWRAGRYLINCARTWSVCLLIGSTGTCHQCQFDQAVLANSPHMCT